MSTSNRRLFLGTSLGAIATIGALPSTALAGRRRCRRRRRHYRCDCEIREVAEQQKICSLQYLGSANGCYYHWVKSCPSGTESTHCATQVYGSSVNPCADCVEIPSSIARAAHGIGERIPARVGPPGHSNDPRGTFFPVDYTHVVGITGDGVIHLKLDDKRFKPVRMIQLQIADVPNAPQFIGIGQETVDSQETQKYQSFQKLNDLTYDVTSNNIVYRVKLVSP